MSEQKANIRKLFPILSESPTHGCKELDHDVPKPEDLRGIARLASLGSVADEGHLVEFRTLPV